MKEGKSGTFSWACLCLITAFMAVCPLSPAQQPATGDSQPAQAHPGADASDNSVNSGQKLSGLAVVIKADAVAEGPVYHADGYVIRVQPGAVTAFFGSLKTLADVVPGTWIHFEGVRDGTGVVVASKAEFFSPGWHKGLTAMGPRKLKNTPDYQPVTHDSILDANGQFVGPHAKVRLSDAGGPCGWHRVPADLPLQERVERIGMQLVPASQKQLPPEDPSRIPFRFYVVDDDKVRSVFACNTGLVLVPKNVVQRLQNDDQLASVLADGVAIHFYCQRVSISPRDMAAVGLLVAEFIPGIPLAGYIAGEAAEGILDHESQVRLRHEIARMALQLMADAGFDPWQAPEAWRLLAPKEIPRDVQSLNYTSEGKYQFDILKLQYKRDSSGPSAVLPASVEGNPAQGLHN